MWNKNNILAAIRRSNEALEHALVGLYMENVFSYKDEEYLSSMAERILDNHFKKPLGQRLSSKQTVEVRFKLKKYCRQMSEIANGAE